MERTPTEAELRALNKVANVEMMLGQSRCSEIVLESRLSHRTTCCGAQFERVPCRCVVAVYFQCVNEFIVAGWDKIGEKSLHISG